MTLDIAIVDTSIQQSHSEVLRRIKVVEDISEKRIRSLEARTEDRSSSLEGRLNLLACKLLSMDTRVNNNLGGFFQRLYEWINKPGKGINGVESRTFKECNETGKRLIQIEDKWQKLAQRCYRGFQKLEADLAELKTSLARKTMASPVASIAENPWILRKFEHESTFVC